jgi:hypothetical protein
MDCGDSNLKHSMQRDLTPEEMELLLSKMRSDLEQANSYLQKLYQDKTKIKYVLDYNKDNYKYLKTHCGVIAMDYIKNISTQISKFEIFFQKINEDITKFEKSIFALADQIVKREQELIRAKEKAKRKVIAFKRNKPTKKND